MDLVRDILFPASLGRINLETEPRIDHRYFVLCHYLTINKQAVCYIQHFTDEPLLQNEAVN